MVNIMARRFYSFDTERKDPNLDQLRIQEAGKNQFRQIFQMQMDMTSQGPNKQKETTGLHRSLRRQIHENIPLLWNL